MSCAIICIKKPFKRWICVGFFDVLLIIVLIVALVGVLLFWEMRQLTYTAIFGLLFVVCVFVMIQGSLGDQIRKQMSEQKAGAGKVKQTG